MQKLLSIILLSLPCVCFSQGVNFTVKGKISNAKSNLVTYLVYAKEDKRMQDSTRVKEGVFELKGTAELPALATIFIGTNTRNLITSTSLYLESGTVTVFTPDLAEGLTVKGNTTNDDNNKLKQVLKSNEDKASELRKVYYTLLDSSETKAAKIVKQQHDVLGDEKKVMQKDFIKNHPQSLVSLDVLSSLGGILPDVNEVEPLFKSLSQEVRESKKGREYGNSIEKAKTIAIGSIAPEFTMPDTAGNLVSLKEFRGKYVLLDFWASWCGPCRAENPNVVKAYKAYKDKNFTVLGVSVDAGEKGKKAWIAAIKKDGLTWTHLSDLKDPKENIAVQLYQVKGVPQNFFIDPSGKIVARNLREEELHKKLEDLLVSE